MQDRRTAIVTGASRGIGRAIAVELGRLGFNVAINYNSNAAAAEEAAGIVKDAGGQALIVQADIASRDDHRKLVDAAESSFGPVHLLVNNAGVAPKVRADLLDMGEESWDYVLDTNLKGPFFLTQLVANRMIAAKPRDGHHAAFQGTFRGIVNIASISSYTASVNRGEYCVAKAGISMMTRVYAARLAAHGINVYEVRPGVIATDMTGAVKAKYDKLIIEDERGIQPIRRWGQPEDVAHAVAAIAEGRLPYSTGEVINVDGGFHLHVL
jgi:3-oxoacyl-[acyl-carrier protein] reductase